MGIFALFSVLTARKYLVGFAIAVACAIALMVGIVLPKEYRSSAKVQVDAIQQDLLTGLFEPRQRVAEFLGQQAAVAGSRTVALTVYDGLIEEGFFLRDEFERAWREETGGELVAGNDARLWAADQLLEKLEIEANSLESTLEISFRSDDAADAARIANAFANAYMSIVLEQRQRRAARNAANFSEETRALETGIETAQRDLTDFREQSGIVGLGAQRLEDIEVELAALTMRLADARTDYSEAKSLLRHAYDASEDELLTLPLPDDTQAGRQAQTRLGAVQVQVQRLSERYGDQYPPFIEAVNEKRALQRTIMQAIEERTEFARRRVEALEDAAAQKKKAVVALQSTKQTYDVLSKKVDASRETYDLVATRSLQESLQSRVDVVEVFMLARAVPANKPAVAPLWLIVLLGAIGGAFLGASAAVALELVEGRIRTRAALSQILRNAVICEVSAPVQRKKARKNSFWQKAAA